MEVEPLLDEAINDLADLDRDAVVLRYFKNQSLREVGAALGSSEDAVQKRLSRAVEKLHAFFASRGKTVSTGAILTGLAGCAAQAVPSGMATCISGSVLSNIILSASTTSTSTLASFHFISAVAMKPILITCAALAMSAVIVLQHHHAGQLKMQNEALLSRANDAESAAALPVGVGRVLPAVPENAPREAELLRLRGEVARLRAVEAELARRQELDRQQEAEARKQAAAAAETKLRFDVQRISTVDAFKQIGLQLRILVNDQKAEEAFQSDGILKANLIAKTHPDFDLGNVELLVKDAELLRELVDKDPQAIITRTRDPIPTPDGRWLRIYGNADGSAVQFTLDYPSQAFTDNWRLEAVKTRKQ